MTSNTPSQRRVAAMLLLLIGIGLAGCAGVATAPSPALQQQIETAHSRADHDALATYYSGEVAKARAMVAEHREMGRRYQAAPTLGRGGASMPAHCNAIADRYEEIASRFDAMAAAHRQMAAQAMP